jgi:hypothetical protein
VEVDPERIARWIDGFGERHGGHTTEGLTLHGGDGATATFEVPPGVPAAADPAALVDAATRPRPLGLLLVRRGGYAVGVAAGADLEVSKVDNRYVQSRTAAGGWSQQRFARRRDNQAHAMAGEVADVAVRLLLPARDRLTALVAGGDRWLADEVLADPRLEPLLPLRSGRFLDVPDPKLAVLQAAARAARTVRVLVRDSR